MSRRVRHHRHLRRLPKGSVKNIPKGQLQDERNIAEDVSNRGHWGNGDYVFYLRSDDDTDYAFDLIRQSYKYHS